MNEFQFKRKEISIACAGHSKQQEGPTSSGQKKRKKNHFRQKLGVRIEPTKKKARGRKLIVSEKKKKKKDSPEKLDSFFFWQSWDSIALICSGLGKILCCNVVPLSIILRLCHCSLLRIILKIRLRGIAQVFFVGCHDNRGFLLAAWLLQTQGLYMMLQCEKEQGQRELSQGKALKMKLGEDEVRARAARAARSA